MLLERKLTGARARAGDTGGLSRSFALLVATFSLVCVPPGTAQEPGRAHVFEGDVRDARTGEPLAGASVSVVGKETRAVTRGDGSFHLTGLTAGVYTLRADRLGYRGETAMVTVGIVRSSRAVAESAEVVIELAPSPIALEDLVVTGTISERGAAEALRPVSVRAGDELQRGLEATVAATLASIPGLGAASMGPAVSQPVIRGLTGDRVLVLEDGTAVGDVSNSGADHTTALDPSSARRIEVVRGPGTLLYGGNGLGGVINVIRDEIPSSVPRHVTGTAMLQTQTATGALGGSATASFAVAERIPLRAEVAARVSGDLKTPVGTMDNTNGEMWSGGIGVARVADWGHLGASVRGYLNDYGIPGFEGGHLEGVRIDMERAASKFRAVVDRPVGMFRNIRVNAAHTWYRHREKESPTDTLGSTIFVRQSASGDFLGRHGGWGPFAEGAIGVRVSWEDFGFGGGLYTPDTRRLAAAIYLLEEVELGSVKIESGLRYDLTLASPNKEDLGKSSIGEIRDRGFRSLSGSLGVLYNHESGLTLGAGFVRAFRTPDVNELYSEGPHLAVDFFEVGNPDLKGEVGRGLDVFVRFESDWIRAEVTGFYNDIRGYIYGEDTGELSRRTLDPLYQFRGNDAVFSGFEASVDVHVWRGLALEGVASSVHGTLKDTAQALPLVPPVRGLVALKYERPLWFIRGEAEMAARQDRVGKFEKPTNGYAVFNAAAGARLTLGGRLNVVTVSLDNARDAEYRNHLSPPRLKEIMPEAGRGLSVTYRVVF